MTLRHRFGCHVVYTAVEPMLLLLCYQAVHKNCRILSLKHLCATPQDGSDIPYLPATAELTISIMKFISTPVALLLIAATSVRADITQYINEIPPCGVWPSYKNSNVVLTLIVSSWRVFWRYYQARYVVSQTKLAYVQIPR